jgi:hypothetical protein
VLDYSMPYGLDQGSATVHDWLYVDVLNIYDQAILEALLDDGYSTPPFTNETRRWRWR